MILTRIIAIQILYLITAGAYKYDFLFKDETVHSSCNIPNVKGIDEYVDLSNLAFELLNNGSLYIHGFLEFITDLGPDNNPLTIQVFKKTRGSWVSTIYNIRHRDFCTAVFDPNFPGNQHVRATLPEERKCPFSKGQIIRIDEASDFTVELADSRFGGEYKIEVIVQLKDLNETLCVNFLTEVYRA